MIHYLFGGKGPTVDTKNSCPLNLLRMIRTKNSARLVFLSDAKVPKMCLCFWLVTQLKPILAGIKSFVALKCVSALPNAGLSAPNLSLK